MTGSPTEPQEHGIDIHWGYEAIGCTCGAPFVENDTEALSLHLQDTARAAAETRVGVLQEQLGTARKAAARTRTEPCGACDHPREDHAVRYAAGIGMHPWRPAPQSGASQTPPIVPHPDGGITLALDPTDPTGSRIASGGGDRLPYRANPTDRKAA